MFSLKSALTWGIGLALGIGLTVSLHPGIRDQVSQALVKTEAMVEGTVGLTEESSASVSTETGSPAPVETGAQLQTGVEAQTGAGVSVSTGNTSTTIGTETGVNVGAEAQSGWSLKKLFYKLTHSSFSLNAEASAEVNPEE